jgi:hypothetical protein
VELSLQRLQIEEACFDGLADNEFQGVVLTKWRKLRSTMRQAAARLQRPSST